MNIQLEQERVSLLHEISILQMYKPSNIQRCIQMRENILSDTSLSLSDIQRLREYIQYRMYND